MARSMTVEQILQTMNGCECNSLTFEGCVAVNNGELWMDGKKIKFTNRQIKRLWNEYMIEELGPNWKAELKAEMEALTI